MINKKLLFFISGVILLVLTTAASAVFGTAVPTRKKYPVWGVDVSNYQGLIDWEKIEKQGVKFAFIKATEGSGHVDESVRRNLKNIKNTSIYHSCYHFFSFDSPGETQAENFINTVSRDEINLPPVVDIEYYADKSEHKPSPQEADEILIPLLEMLEENYGTKPILYTTLPVYKRYIAKKYSDYPLWIRCTQMEPDFVKWQFWQYSDNQKLDGYYGEEPCIDINVFNGTEEEFNNCYDN